MSGILGGGGLGKGIGLKPMIEGWSVTEGVLTFGRTIGWVELPYGLNSLAFFIWLLIGGRRWRRWRGEGEMKGEAHGCGGGAF